MHDMWLGVIAGACGKVSYIPRPLIQYRRHSSNATPLKRRGWQRMLQDRLGLLGASIPRLLGLYLPQLTGKRRPPGKL
jgi:hypothetical protein